MRRISYDFEITVMKLCDECEITIQWLGSLLDVYKMISILKDSRVVNIKLHTENQLA